MVKESAVKRRIDDAGEQNMSRPVPGQPHVNTDYRQTEARARISDSFISVAEPSRHAAAPPTFSAALVSDCRLLNLLFDFISASRIPTMTLPLYFEQPAHAGPLKKNNAFHRWSYAFINNRDGIYAALYFIKGEAVIWPNFTLP